MFMCNVSIISFAEQLVDGPLSSTNPIMVGVSVGTRSAMLGVLTCLMVITVESSLGK